MALAATDSNIEARIARLESDVSHIRSDLGDVKQDIRELRVRVDIHAERFDEMRSSVDKRFEELRDRMEAMGMRLSDRINAVERSIASAKVWALLLFMAQAAAVYGTLARTMGWN